MIADFRGCIIKTRVYVNADAERNDRCLTRPIDLFRQNPTELLATGDNIVRPSNRESQIGEGVDHGQRCDKR